MEVPKIIKLLRMAADSRYSQTPELLYEAADSLEKLTVSPESDNAEVYLEAYQELLRRSMNLNEMLLKKLKPDPENKPLTVEQLRKMNGKPVYLVINDGESTLEMWALVCVDDVNYQKDKPIVLRNYLGGHEMFFNDKELEQEEIHAYARKPEVHTLKVEELPKPNICRIIPPKEEN